MPDTQFPSVVELLQRMVQFNTVNTVVSGNLHTEQPLAELLEQVARQWGFATRRLDVPQRGFNLLVTHEAGRGKPWLLFDSHLDTVAIDGMTIEPLAAKITNGKLWGRGSCDTKGTGAAMLWALRQYREAKEQPNNIAIVFTIDEEFSMTGIRALIAHWPALGFKPVGVVVGEPTLLKPVAAHNGAVRWKITTKGVAAHSSDPSKGRSAITAMVSVVSAIESQYIPSLSTSHAMTGKSQCSVNIIQGGNQINIVPEQCTVQLDRRVVPGEDEHAVLPVVQRLLDDLSRKDPKLEVAQELIFACPPLDPRGSMKLLPAVQRSLAKLGLPTEPMGVGYATNGGDLSKANIPTIVIGPGSIAQAHTKDEFLEVDQLHKGVALYQALMHETL